MKRSRQHFLALESFHELLVASTIAESIISVPVAAKAQEALEIMNQRHFDVLGLAEEGRIVGYLAKKELEDGDDLTEPVCGSFKNDFEIMHLVSESCPLEDCISKLGQTERLFLLRSTGIDGIITRADLHKQPVRMLLFSVISLLEMTLLSLIRKEYADDKEWKTLLCKRRLEKAKRLLQERQDAGMEIDLVDCLQLCDKGEIIRKTDDLRKQIGFMSKGKCEAFFEHLEKIRNALAHGLAFEAIPNLAWQQVFDTFQKAQEVLEKGIALFDSTETKGPEDAESSQ
jgi:predicted transcriptional regulator